MNAAPRYEPLVKLASGGMATVWIGAARGALGFRQLVAIKRPHPQLLEQPGARQELVEEARLASMIRHANVVDVRDVEEDGETISLVMDFIEGASLGELLVAGPIPARVVVRIVRDACAGLHAAHELVDERGRAVGLIHRDISPQNILVGDDGIARVTDFGVAKFARRDGSKSTTGQGTLKGKLAYMAPEYLRNEPIDRRADVFGLGVVLWEALVGKRCFRGADEPDTYVKVLEHEPEAVSKHDPALAALDGIVACALAKDAKARFQNAAAMGVALENAAMDAGLMGTAAEVAAALRTLAGEKMARRRAEVQAKLAHEPSLASLGLSPQQSPLGATLAPDTEPSRGATLASDTEQSRGTTRAPDTEPSPEADTLQLTSSPVPDTVPLTAPLQSGTTLPLTDTPRRVEAPVVTANAYEITPSAPPRSRALPFIIGGAALVLAALIGGAAARSTPTAVAAPAPSSPAPLASAPPSAAPASSPADPPTPTVAASAPAKPHPVASAPPPHQNAGKSALPKPPPSAKHPDANPYE